MDRNRDMWRVQYPDDTGPLHAPLSFERLEEPTMANVEDFQYVDLYGNEVAADDPAAQAKYAPAELKALRKGGFFPAPPGAVADAVDDDAPSPVLHSGVGTPEAEADGDEKPARHRK